MSQMQQTWTHVWGANEQQDREICRDAGLDYCESGNPAQPGRKAYHAGALSRSREDGYREVYCPICGAAWGEIKAPEQSPLQRPGVQWVARVSR